MKGNVQDEEPRTTMLAISQLDSIHLHPSEAFTQNDLQCIHLLGIEPMTLELLKPRFLHELNACMQTQKTSKYVKVAKIDQAFTSVYLCKVCMFLASGQSQPV